MALLEVGRIGKAHGLRGEVSVRLISDRLERVAPGSQLQTNRGVLTVVSSRPHQNRWIVQFEGVAGRTAAEELQGTVLSAEAIDDPSALFVHDLIGAHVVDADGIDRGVVRAVQANPASDLLVLDGDVLVPMVFIVGDVERADGGDGGDGTDGGDGGGSERRVVRVEVPDGLFDL
ncbi:MAG: ribosome maturation factor RimM [Microthrixaceae bacterium]